MSAIRTAIIDRIVDTGNVDGAYREVASRASHDLAVAVRSGEPLRIVLDRFGLNETARKSLRPDISPPLAPHTFYVVIGGGGVDDVPDPGCVAERLKGKPNPTRSDIEEAFAACLASRTSRSTSSG